MGRPARRPTSRRQLPLVRAACADVPRPCPYVSCRHHLYVDAVLVSGRFKLTFPSLQPWELKVSCVLDVADRDGCTLEEVGEIMNLTRERIRQIEHDGLAKLRAAGLLVDMFSPTPEYTP